MSLRRRGRPAMADHDERRPFASRCRALRIERRVIERVRSTTLASRKFQGLRDGNRQGRPFRAASVCGPPKHLDRPGCQLHPHDRLGFRRRRRHHHRVRRSRPEPLQRLENRRDVCVHVDCPPEPAESTCPPEPWRRWITASRHRPSCVYVVTIRSAAAIAHVAVPKTHSGRPNSARAGGSIRTGSTCESYRYSRHQPSRSLAK